MSREYKLLFAGPMGAGKTTAIAAISDSAPISTEARNTDIAQHSKAQTTVGFDYGEVALEGGDRLRLYGMPGQSRFDFIWKVASAGALGVVMLADNSRPDPLADLSACIDAFTELAAAHAMVVGVGRGGEGRLGIDDYGEWLAARGHVAPVFSVDVRRRDDVLLLIDALLNQIETRELLAGTTESRA
ncbi:GTP-binding protein [Solimonas terrae]|uniref:GTP-binding protein n=1 Tax=Solimonas terrae TaxID=1396819 RepID=A0A6M2BUQ8_9GAMM|nr:ATP/GTP-binding protein [Solimonas terrae]NGY05667.1 GTP-binding protein [Solimonas terrae]